ncbi:hypothetical protein V6N11_082963 [Hibiscus sabdariffa]|uniref:Uncharacterized protein n=1 Tax=Hibiscus sabdariffa TaxID=183260 RepID=A0ABR2QKF9_9ROSI
MSRPAANKNTNSRSQIVAVTRMVRAVDQPVNAYKEIAGSSNCALLKDSSSSSSQFDRGSPSNNKSCGLRHLWPEENFSSQLKKGLELAVVVFDPS